MEEKPKGEEKEEVKEVVEVEEKADSKVSFLFLLLSSFSPLSQPCYYPFLPFYLPAATNYSRCRWPKN